MVVEFVLVASRSTLSYGPFPYHSGLGAANSPKSPVDFQSSIGAMNIYFSPITCDKWILIIESKLRTKVRMRVFQVLGIVVHLDIFHVIKRNIMYLAQILNTRIGLLVMLAVWLDHSTFGQLVLDAWPYHPLLMPKSICPNLFSYLYIWPLNPNSFLLAMVTIPIDDERLRDKLFLFHTATCTFDHSTDNPSYVSVVTPTDDKSLWAMRPYPSSYLDHCSVYMNPSRVVP